MLNMNKNKLQTLAASFIASVALAAPFGLNAADNTPGNNTNTPAKIEIPSNAKKAEKPAAEKTSSLPYQGHIVAVDKTAKTFSLGKKEVRVFSVTDSTKVTKGDAVATLNDLAVGDKVTGAYNKIAGGKLEAVSVKIGKDKAQADVAPVKAGKKEKAAPAATPKA